MKKTKLSNIKNQQECSVDEEMLMWTSYRYCIGRKTYVSSLASYMAKKYYNILSKERKEFTASDIRNCIEDVFRFGGIDFNYDYNVNRNERNPVMDFMMWINDNINDEKDWLNIKSVVCYKESYNPDAPKLFKIITSDNPSRIPVYQHEFSDLMIWNDLATLFDVKNHKIVHVNFNGQEQDIECFESIVQDTVPCEDNPGYCKFKDWSWKKVWKSVDNFISRGEYCGYIDEEFIVDIKDM